jgi:hypothetical protein
MCTGMMGDYIGNQMRSTSFSGAFQPNLDKPEAFWGPNFGGQSGDSHAPSPGRKNLGPEDSTGGKEIDMPLT